MTQLHSGSSCGHLTTQADHLWRELCKVKRALRKLVKVLDCEPFATQEDYELIQAAMEEAKELLS